MMGTDGQGSSWLGARIGWDAIRATLSAQRVARRNFSHFLGGITLLLFLLEVGSGVLVLLYYRPDVAQAHASLERIVGEVPYGDLIRNVHAWSSDLLVLSLVAHMFTVVVRGSFRSPRELSWWSGQALLVLCIGLAFTGAILPWSQEAYLQARVGSELARYVPFVGNWLHHFLRGGDEVTSSTLQHAFGFHVAALPAAVTALIFLHLFFVQRRAATTPRDDDAPTMPVYPDFLVRQAAAWTATFVVVMTLAIFAQRSVGVAADPRLPSVVGARPPWYFLAFHHVVRVAPRDLLGMDGARFLVAAMCGVGLAVVALPLLDRRGSRLTAYLAWIFLLACALLSAYALT